jgi:hypothetical protein
MPEDEEASVEDVNNSLDSGSRISPFGSTVMIKEFKNKCTALVEALGPALEACWKIHPQFNFQDCSSGS